MSKIKRVIASVRTSYRRTSYRVGSWFGGLLVAASLVYTASRIGRPVSGWEEEVGELVALVGGIAGSFIASRSAFRAHARSAFRRLTSMYVGLGQITEAAICNPPEEHEALVRIEAIASVHAQTARDALEDWADLAPNEVAELRGSLRRREAGATEEVEPVNVLPLGSGAVTRHGVSDK